jgi:hypothetical protein
MFTKGGSRGWIVSKCILWGRGRNYEKTSDKPDLIPAGFEFESSVPWWGIWLLDPDDPKFLLSAAVHDWYLEQGFRRSFCDSQWFDAALKSKAPRFKRNLIYMLMVIRSGLLGKNEIFK